MVTLDHSEWSLYHDPTLLKVGEYRDPGQHEGYDISQRKRKRVEEIFGWAKTVGLIRKAKLQGRENIDWLFTMSIAVFNLVRMRNMEAEA